MSVILVMTIGWFIGFRYFKEKYVAMNSIFQTICVAMLIFCMGVSLGSRPTFFDDLAHLGISAIFYAIVPIAFSIICVYFLTEITLNKRGDSDDNNSDS